MQEKTKREKPKKEFEELLLEVRRVTRVTTGGRQLSFRAIILVGNKNGKIGLGVSKGTDVQIAVRKATNEAYKNMKVIPITEGGSIPYAVSKKYKSAYITLIPAAPGTGLKAGSSLRSVMELAGYTNILSKIMGTTNKLNNALAAVMALTTFKVDRSKLEKLNLHDVMETRKKQQAEAEAERAARAKRPRRNDDKRSAPRGKAAPAATPAAENAAPAVENATPAAENATPAVETPAEAPAAPETTESAE